MAGSDEVVARRVVVHGLVQGVFFRDTCRSEAQRRGVGGWVRNSPDGTVEAVFEGPATLVAEMCRWCERGPREAVVDRLDITAQPPSGETGFHIRV